MSRPLVADLDNLAHGRPVAKDAFLALLGDPGARDALSAIAQTQEVLEPPGGDEAVPPLMEVGWVDLIAYADGTLADLGRRQLVEEFLCREAPELLRPAEEASTELALGGDTETWPSPGERAKGEPGGEAPPRT